jgi:hypothetical protein
VLGGLVISTIFTLVLVPMGFSLVVDAERLLARLFRRSTDESTGSEPVPQLSASQR